MIEDEARRERERQDRAAAPAADALGQSARAAGKPPTRGATAEELSGVSAVPTEGGEDGDPPGAGAAKAAGDEADPGVG